MAVQPPYRLLHTGVPLGEQPPGTTPVAFNVRSRNRRDGGIRQVCRREGFTKLVEYRQTDSPVRALSAVSGGQSSGLEENLTLLADPFINTSGGDTSAGDLNPDGFVGTYSVFQGATGTGLDGPAGSDAEYAETAVIGDTVLRQLGPVAYSKDGSYAIQGFAERANNSFGGYEGGVRIYRRTAANFYQFEAEIPAGDVDANGAAQPFIPQFGHGDNNPADWADINATYSNGACMYAIDRWTDGAGNDTAGFCVLNPFVNDETSGYLGGRVLYFKRDTGDPTVTGTWTHVRNCLYLRQSVNQPDVVTNPLSRLAGPILMSAGYCVVRANPTSDANTVVDAGGTSRTNAGGFIVINMETGNSSGRSLITGAASDYWYNDVPTTGGDYPPGFSCSRVSGSEYICVAMPSPGNTPSLKIHEFTPGSLTSSPTVTTHTSDTYDTGGGATSACADNHVSSLGRGPVEMVGRRIFASHYDYGTGDVGTERQTHYLVLDYSSGWPADGAATAYTVQLDENLLSEGFVSDIALRMETDRLYILARYSSTVYPLAYDYSGGSWSEVVGSEGFSNQTIAAEPNYTVTAPDQTVIETDNTYMANGAVHFVGSSLHSAVSPGAGQPGFHFRFDFIPPGVTGPYSDESESAVVDDQDVGALGVKLWGVAETSLADTPDATITLVFTTASSFADGIVSTVGLLAYADVAVLGAGTRDGSLAATMTVDGTGKSDLSFVRSVPEASGGSFLAAGSATIDYQFETDTEYTIRLLLDGALAEFRIAKADSTEFDLLAICPNFLARPGGGSYPVSTDIANRAHGFVLAGVGGTAADQAIATVDHFSIGTTQQVVESVDPAVIGVVDTSYVYFRADEARLVTNGAGVLTGTSVPMFVHAPVDVGGVEAGATVALDGQAYRIITGGSARVMVASPGTMPESDDGSRKCKYGVAWLNRLVLWGLETNKANWYMSRSGDWTDWDYLSDTGRFAVAGDTTDTGVAPFEIVAAIPLAGDTLLLCGSMSMAYIRGDPVDGGYMDDISDKNGIAGPKAWTIDERGNRFFTSQQGIFLIPFSPDGALQFVEVSSGRLDGLFDSINWTTARVEMAYSRIERAVYTRIEDDAFCSHVICYGIQDGSLACDTYPDFIGPTAIADALDLNGRGLFMMGCQDGYIRRLTVGADTDDGEPINAEVWMPAYDSRQERVVLAETEVKLGGPAQAVKVGVASAFEANELLKTDDQFAFSVYGNHPQRSFNRIGGSAVGVRLRSLDEAYFGLSSLALTIEGAGKGAR